MAMEFHWATLHDKRNICSKIRKSRNAPQDIYKYILLCSPDVVALKAYVAVRCIWELTKHLPVQL